MSQPGPQEAPPDVRGTLSQLLLALTSRISPTSMRTDAQEEPMLAHYRRQIDSFDEDREDLGAKLVRKAFTIVAYLAPFLVAYFIGKEIGDYYGGVPFDPTDGWNGAMHIAAWGGEASLAMMVISTARAWRQYTKDSGNQSFLIASLVAFVLFTLASGFAQWVIADVHIHPQAFNDYAALIFRVAMPTGVDVASLLWLGIMRYKSLKQYLIEKQQKAQAIRLLNEAEIAIEDAQQGAKQRREQANQYLAGQAALQDLLLQIGQIQGQAMVETAKLALTKGTHLTIAAPQREEAGSDNHHHVPTSFPAS